MNSLACFPEGRFFTSVNFILIKRIAIEVLRRVTYPFLDNVNVLQCAVQCPETCKNNSNPGCTSYKDILFNKVQKMGRRASKLLGLHGALWVLDERVDWVLYHRSGIDIMSKGQVIPEDLGTLKGSASLA